MEPNVENMKKCPSFDSCNKNFCPLDPAILIRAGNKRAESCRWLKWTRIRKKQITQNGHHKTFTTGQCAMTSELLKYVPHSNIPLLNETTLTKLS